MSALETAHVAPEETVSPEKLARQAKNAAAKEQARIAFEAKTTVRKCLGCSDEFRSEGAGHRMCNRCRSRR